MATVDYVINGKNKLSQVLKDIDKDADVTDKKLNQLGNKDIGGNGSMFKNIVGGNLVARGIEMASSAMVDFGRDTFRAYGEFEQFQVALKTLMYGNVEGAKQLSNELVGFAAKTPFELKELQGYTTQLMAMGFRAKEIIPTLTELGDIAGGVGKDKLPFIVHAMGQIKSTGYLTGKELMELTMQGVNPLNEMVKKTGKSQEVLRKEMEKHLITYSMVNDSFKTMTEKGGQFYNMMDEQSHTLLGATSNLADSWEQLKVQIGASQEGILKQTVAWLTSFVSKMTTGMKNYNSVDKALEEGNGNYSFVDKIAHYGGGGIFGADKMAKDAQYYEEMNRRYNGDKDSPLQAANNRVQLLQLIRNLNATQAGKGNINAEMMVAGGAKNIDVTLSQDEKLRSLSILKYIERNLNSKINNKDITPEDKTGKAGKETDTGTGTTIQSGTPKNLYITVNGGIGNDAHFVSQNGEIPSDFKDKFIRYWMELVNDSYLANA